MWGTGQDGNPNKPAFHITKISFITYRDLCVVDFLWDLPAVGYCARQIPQQAGPSCYRDLSWTTHNSGKRRHGLAHASSPNAGEAEKGESLEFREKNLSQITRGIAS